LFVTGQKQRLFLPITVPIALAFNAGSPPLKKVMTELKASRSQLGIGVEKLTFRDY